MITIIDYIKIILVLPFIIVLLIFQSLFGIKYFFKDDFFGEIESEKVLKSSKKKLISWHPNFKLHNAPEESFISINGDINKPDLEQLTEVKQIINDYDGLLVRLNLEIEKYFYDNRNLKSKWNIDDLKNNYWMDSLIYIDGNYEISFIPIEDDNQFPNISFELDLNNDEILDFDFF